MRIERGDAGWDAARQPWHLSTDQQPAAIAVPASVEELRDDVRAARADGLRIAVQATGHGAGLLGPLDETLLLKTTQLRGIETRDDTLLAGAGVLAADAAAAAGEQRRAPVLGFAPTVGVTGLALSGGFGWLGRTHGLAANNVRSFEAVLPNGERVQVDADQEPDLYWALRGGGGRGAIVTAIELETHAVPNVFAGSIAWPAERAAEVLEQFRRCALVAPEALTLVFRRIAPAGLVMIIAAYLGSEADAVEALKPLRAGGGAVFDTFGTVAPGALARVAGDPEEPSPGEGDGFLLDELTLEGSERIAATLADDAIAMLELRQLGGALRRPPRDHGALGQLDGGFSLYAGVMEDLDPVDALREQLAPWVSQQTVLSLSRAGVDPAAGFDAPTWARLQRVRDAYDPDGVLISTHDLYAETT